MNSDPQIDKTIGSTPEISKSCHLFRVALLINLYTHDEYRGRSEYLIKGLSSGLSVIDIMI